jgi:CRISPR-associated endonuclease Cas1
LADIFCRDSTDSAVLVADGYGLSVTVSRGHLLVRDGLGRHRRERRLPRAQRTVQRIVILGHTGVVSLEAIRWCADTGIALLQIDIDGRVLMLAATPSRTDARLLRAQAAAPAGPVGVGIARNLLHAKITEQAAVADGLLDQPGIAQAMRGLADQLAAATTLPGCRGLEAQAANLYFSAWSAVRCRFANRDHPRVPDHWRAFSVRASPLNRSGHAPRNAADPVNALLNYGYALAEAEARLAALAVRLDPTLGIIHTDQKARDSLALDLLEPLRPVVEDHVLRLLAERTFRVDDFAETREGRCRLLPPLTHQLAELLLPDLARAVAHPAEAIAHALAHNSPAKIDLRTPLSRANTTRAQTRGQRSEHRQSTPGVAARKTCQRCGADLYGSARKLCPTCWPVMRNSYLKQVNATRTKQEQPAKPTPAELSGGWTLQHYQERILPGLADLSLLDIEKATGLSNPTCSRLKRGLQIPNPKHWNALATLAGVT